MSTSFHPETDGSSERSNRTMIQALRFHVERNQKGWARALPHVRFNYMNTINVSTGFTPFHLLSGHSPRLIPPLFDAAVETFGENAQDAADRIKALETDVLEAQDNLLLARSQQAFQANKRRGKENVYKVGDKVLLSTFHRRREFVQRRDHRMCRFDGPYTVIQAWPNTSVYTLDLLDHARKCPNASLLRPFITNDDGLFPGRRHALPGPIINEDGAEEFYVDRVLDVRSWGRGKQYLVSWTGYGPEANRWLRRDLIEVTASEAFEVFLRENNLE